MSYGVRVLFLNQTEPLPSEQMEGPFTELQKAGGAGTAEVLAYQLRSIEASVEVLDADDQIVEVSGK